MGRGIEGKRGKGCFCVSYLIFEGRAGRNGMKGKNEKEGKGDQSARYGRGRRGRWSSALLCSALLYPWSTCNNDTVKESKQAQMAIQTVQKRDLFVNK